MGTLPAGSYVIKLYFTRSIISLFFLFFVVNILSTVVTLSPLTRSAKPPRFNTFSTYQPSCRLVKMGANGQK